MLEHLFDRPSFFDLPHMKQHKHTKRLCKVSKCIKGARGSSGLCQRHGEGRRCCILNCSTGAIGAGWLCSKHGGAKPCSVPSCTTGARGKSGLCFKHSRPSRDDKDDLIIPLLPTYVDTLLEMDEYFQDSTDYCDSFIQLRIQ